MLVPLKPHAIAGIESRGFIFGASVAAEIGVGFVPIRKPGKLPWKTRRESYALEYGTDAIEVHEDAVASGTRVALVDDLLATGGTAGAAIKLLQGLGGQVVGAAFVIELAFLHGRERLGGVPAQVLIAY
jgi:adenine phosphoribosyltransferase